MLLSWDWRILACLACLWPAEQREYEILSPTEPLSHGQLNYYLCMVAIRPSGAGLCSLRLLMAWWSTHVLGEGFCAILLPVNISFSDGHQ